MKELVTSSIPKRTRWEWLVYLLPIPVFFCALCMGSYRMSLAEMADIISYSFAGHSLSGAPVVENMVIALMRIRLPRVILSMLVGAALSVSGAAFQSIMRNPLVEPYTLGVSSGAAFGAALSMAFGFLPVQLSAFVFSVVGIAVCYAISQRKGEVSVISLILAGIIISSIFSAALSAIQLIVDPLKLQGLIFWTMGAFYTTTWAKVLSSGGPMAIGFITVFTFRWKLNILSLGDKEAKMLGVNPTLYKAIFLFSATLLASSAVAVTGIIGLVGLMIPHICRMVFGPDNQRLIPLSMALGGAYLTIVDTMARNLFTFEVPVGIFTTFFGAPFFIALLRISRADGWN